MQLISEASAEKLRGGYYTPPAIASFILRWGINGDRQDDILEPSCGDGVFLERLAESGLPYRSVKAIEYDNEEAAKADAVMMRDKTIVNGDFHEYCMSTNDKYDLVVGNPPYIRYQFYNQSQQKFADKIFRRAGLKFSKLTNAWVTFVVGCSLLLKDNGKMGFVVPAELLQVGYALQLRKYLAKTFNKITIVSFEKLVFDSIQQEVVLLLCQKDGTLEHNIEHIEVNDAAGLTNIDAHLLDCPTKKIDFKSSKWTYYFLNQKEIDFLDKVKKMKMPVIADYADVEVGITTGSNPYFTVPKSVVNMFQLEECAKPMVGRSVQVNSINLTLEDWKTNVNNGARAYLLVFPPNAKEKGNLGVKAYLANGETEKINKGYKTRIRDEWYVIPSIKISDALFIRRNNLYPRLINNEARAYTTDTMHRVFVRKVTDREAFIASYYNSLSLAFAEICGRSYGGGVLELMPSEVKNIALPYNTGNAMLLKRIDMMMREKTGIDEILKLTDNIILKQNFGFTDADIAIANNIWKKLSSRRLKRGERSADAKNQVEEDEKKVCCI